jgi:hypothetical protein
VLLGIFKKIRGICRGRPPNARIAENCGKCEILENILKCFG